MSALLPLVVSGVVAEGREYVSDMQVVFVGEEGDGVGGEEGAGGGEVLTMITGCRFK